jgi:hypothetical protein
VDPGSAAHRFVLRRIRDTSFPCYRSIKFESNASGGGDANSTLPQSIELLGGPLNRPE